MRSGKLRLHSFQHLYDYHDRYYEITRLQDAVGCFIKLLKTASVLSLPLNVKNVLTEKKTSKLMKKFIIA